MPSRTVVGGGGGRSAYYVCDPESELRKGGNWRSSRANIIDGMRGKKKVYQYMNMLLYE